MVSVEIASAASDSEQKYLEWFDGSEGVGSPKLEGSASYDPVTQTFQINGAGDTIWMHEDQFHFLWKLIKGDFIVTATVRFLDQGGKPHRKMGIMARETLTGDSRYVSVSVHGDTHTSLAHRDVRGALTRQAFVQTYHPTDIAFGRSGNTFTLSSAVLGENYKTLSYKIDLPELTYVGLYVCSHDEDTLTRAVFTNVRIVIPAPAVLENNNEYAGSCLEVMDVQTGLRKRVQLNKTLLRDPCWSPNNKEILYNSDGRLYRYNLETGGISPLDIPRYDSGIYHHLLSADGSQVAIRYQQVDREDTVIFALSTEGVGKQLQVMNPDIGPSVLQCWSPDLKRIVFSSVLNEKWSIWSKDISRGIEVLVSSDERPDGGADYSPDGKFLYFSSIRTGTMQIWRTRTDGSGLEQITFDDCDKQFPRISPNGKWIAYLAVPADGGRFSNSSYRLNYLKIMRTSGSVPKTVAYIYVEANSASVPTWSPDSRQIAFVSYVGGSF